MSLNFIPPKPPQKLERPSLRSTLAVFVAAFLILLAIFNWPTLVLAVSYPFTHSDEKDNEQITEQYRALYGYAARRTLAQTQTQTQTQTVFPQQDQISIAKLGISAPIIQVGSTDDKVVLNALKNGVVLYPGSGNPGGGGTAVIIGHSSSDLPWTKYSAIFATLDKLVPNDIITVSFSGREYTYQVRVIEKGTIQQVLDSGLAGDLILASCWPPGTDKLRIAVSAVLLR